MCSEISTLPPGGLEPETFHTESRNPKPPSRIILRETCCRDVKLIELTTAE